MVLNPIEALLANALVGSFGNPMILMLVFGLFVFILIAVLRLPLVVGLIPAVPALMLIFTMDTALTTAKILLGFGLGFIVMVAILKFLRR